MLKSIIIPKINIKTFRLNKNNSNLNYINYKELVRSAVRTEMVYSDPEYIKQIWDYTKSDEDVVLDEVKIRHYDELYGVNIEPLFINSPIETHADAQAYLWEKDDILYLTFRGTSSKGDALADINVLSKKIKDKIFVHKGFYNQFKSIETLITNELKSEKYENIKTIHISGHSLAAALSQIASAYYGEMFPEKKIICHVFGCPRVGNKHFKQWFEKNVEEHLRIANSHDPITMIPQRSLWIHTSKCLTLYNDNEYKITEKDIPWYMRFISCLVSIDYLKPIKDHECELYIKRLENLTKRDNIIPPKMEEIGVKME